jgi:hypothetical protein
MVFLAGHFVTGFVHRNLWRSLDEMQSYLRMLKNTPPKNHPFTSWFWTYTEFTSLLFKYAKNTACRMNGKAE